MKKFIYNSLKTCPFCGGSSESLCICVFVCRYDVQISTSA